MSSGIISGALPLAQAPALPPPAPGPVVSSVVSLLNRWVDRLHGFFPHVDETLFRGIAALCIVALAVLLRRFGANATVALVRRMTGRTETDLKERIFNALAPPLAAVLMICGIYAALNVLKLGAEGQHLTAYGARIAVAGIFLWGVFRLGEALLDNFERTIQGKNLFVFGFMPLIRKTLGVLFVVLSTIVIAERMGAEVKTYLAGLGIGGLALALAAQDALANLFGSFVVVLDQPFRIGDTVRIGASEGAVEDIGLRSTRLRTGARTQVIIPNKTVSGEIITNLTRMPQRRVDQTIGLTYATGSEQMQAILGDLRSLLLSDPGVHPGLIAVNFAEFDESSLNIEIVYFTNDPDWQKHMDVRERINFGIMRAVTARGLSFAFPTQTVIHENPPPA